MTKNLKTLPGYTYQQLLGSGSYADVYKCIKIQTGQIYAVKIFKTLKHNQPDTIKKQINIVRKLNHPNIVQCVDVFQDPQNKNKLYAAVFQYCGKGNLQQYVLKQIQQNNKIPQDVCKSYICKILSALVYIHQNKIAHRDLKLANILINDQYQVKLADFGLSKSFEEASMLQTFCGTPLTMAPQILSKRKYTPKCDTWSFGVVSYFLLFSQYPYNAKDPMQLLETIKRQKVPKFPPKVQVSQKAKQFLRLCLTLDLQKRPTIQQLLQNQWLKQKPQSQIRQTFMKQSLGQQSQLIKRTNKIIIHSLNEQIYKLITQNNLTQNKINLIKNGFNQFYPNQKQKLYQFYYFVGKRIKVLMGSKIQLKLGNQSFKLKIMKLKKLQNHINHILSTIGQKIQSLMKQVVFDNQRLQRSDEQLIKFVVQEGRKSEQQRQINKNKMKFYINLFEFINKQKLSSSIQITLNNNSKKVNKNSIQTNNKQINYQNLIQQFNSYISNILKEQKIYKMVNNDVNNIMYRSHDQRTIQNLLNVQLINSPNQQFDSNIYRLVSQVCQRALRARLNAFA